MTHSSASKYLGKMPETLVLKGYRYWSLGIATQDADLWNKAWNLFATKVQKESAKACMHALIIFIKTLGVCATCPLKTLQPACEELCRDECLVLGLISGFQHGNDEAVDFCLKTLSCPKKYDEIAFAAGEFAFTLKAAGFLLIPISTDTLIDITYEQMPSKALH
ncbi:MAG: hypothetical protein ABJ081_08045 [Hyphomicrobiales bacterium]